MHRFYYFIISACMLFTSCNKDEVITEEVGGQPIIELDSETGFAASGQDIYSIIKTPFPQILPV